MTEYEEKKLAVSRKRMITKAKELQKQLGEAQELQFSKGWLDRFMKFYGITLIRTTTVCQRPPADYEDKLVQFVFYVGHLLDTENYDKSMIFGCDETAVWIDPPSFTTLAHRGAKDVPVSSLQWVIPK